MQYPWLLHGLRPPKRPLSIFYIRRGMQRVNFPHWTPVPILRGGGADRS